MATSKISKPVTGQNIIFTSHDVTFTNGSGSVDLANNIAPYTTIRGCVAQFSSQRVESTILRSVTVSGTTINVRLTSSSNITMGIIFVLSVS